MGAVWLKQFSLRSISAILFKMDYKDAGVDINEGYRAVEKYRDLAAETRDRWGASILNGIGSFAGMFSLKDAAKGMEEPVLVSGTDGVGTKLELARIVKKYDTVGIDCVAMCVNDILCHGARPLFFLDYLACGKLDANIASELVSGIAAGCKEAGCALLGGETAEMPGFYSEGSYEIAGFAAGIADRKNIIDGRNIRKGDALLGIGSSGAHSNGFSLIRKVFPDMTEDHNEKPLALALLEPTRIYVQPVLGLMETIPVHGMAHITGGGFYENIPRMFFSGGNEHYNALIYQNSWPIPSIFKRIAAACAGLNTSGTEAEQAGEQLLKTDLSLRSQMFATFNMGIGFGLALDKEYVKKAKAYLEQYGFSAWEIGVINTGDDSDNTLNGSAGQMVHFI